MHFVQKIYYINKPLILTNQRSAYLQEHPPAAAYRSFTGAFERNFRQAIACLDTPGCLGAIIEDISIPALQQSLHKLYTPIDAAGGVVVNDAGSVLMIFRRGKWDLPKGKLDEGEDMARCALREVTEETGLQQLELGSHICDTYHIYNMNREDLLKRTAWYRMRATGHEPLVPQQEENILEARWIQPSELPPLTLKTYEAIREVLQQAGFLSKN